jgi:hypothetical protein
LSGILYDVDLFFMLPAKPVSPGSLGEEYIQVLIAQELRQNSKWIISNGGTMAGRCRSSIFGRLMGKRPDRTL